MSDHYALVVLMLLLTVGCSPEPDLCTIDGYDVVVEEAATQRTARFHLEDVVGTSVGGAGVAVHFAQKAIYVAHGEQCTRLIRQSIRDRWVRIGTIKEPR